jgi:N-acetylmuramoyl-L-alanine amidase
MAPIWKGAHPQNFRSGRPAGHRPEAIVIHIMDGSLIGTDAWFNDPRSGVSAHYGVGRNGVVHQYVREMDTAFHAGTVVGPTWPLLKPGVNPNYYTIGVEHEGFGESGGAWSQAMLDASVDLVRDIAGRWNIPADDDHIIRHRLIRSTKPHCPGAGVNLDAYIARIATAAAPPAAAAESPAAIAARIVSNANIRRLPRVEGLPLRTLLAGDRFQAVAVAQGERVGGNDRWLRNAANEYVWAGNTDHPQGLV